jgi:hypothetical protein
MRKLSSAALVLSVSLGAVLGPVPAAAQQEAATSSVEPTAEQKKEASQRFEKGVSFYRDGEYQAALLEFKRAYELFPNYRVLYNLGQTSRELKDHASALVAFERYLAEGDKIDAARKRDVENWIAELRTKVARVSVATNVPGAEITVDDLLVGTTPLAEPILLNAGRRKVSATLSGHVPVQRYIDVAGADTAELSLELVSLVAPAPTGPARADATPPPAPKKVESRSPRWAWVGLATTGALGVATGILGVRALDSQSELDSLLTQRTTTAELEDARSQTESFALATDIVGAITIAAAATTVVLFVVESGGGDADGAEASSSARLRLGPGALYFDGSF